ncbi:hypothetical protein AKO1_004736 [Acrasis kona]|uniref:Uncharacterized protein n=1 Tax=Acrasis kona TaxID=1008807 RepID=A0AAW2Z354_9EUKA
MKIAVVKALFLLVGVVLCESITNITKNSTAEVTWSRTGDIAYATIPHGQNFWQDVKIYLGERYKHSVQAYLSYMGFYSSQEKAHNLTLIENFLYINMSDYHPSDTMYIMLVRSSPSVRSVKIETREGWGTLRDDIRRYLVYIVIGSITGVTLLVVALAIIVVLCCTYCNRRQRRPMEYQVISEPPKEYVNQDKTRTVY